MCRVPCAVCCVLCTIANTQTSLPSSRLLLPRRRTLRRSKNARTPAMLNRRGRGPVWRRNGGDWKGTLRRCASRRYVTQKKSIFKSHYAYYFVKYSHWEYSIGSIVQDVLFHYDIQFQFTVYYSGAHVRFNSNLKCAHFSPSFLPLFSPIFAGGVGGSKDGDNGAAAGGCGGGCDIARTPVGAGRGI